MKVKTWKCMPEACSLSMRIHFKNVINVWNQEFLSRKIEDPYYIHELEVNMGLKK